jgi:hypothetical protein
VLSGVQKGPFVLLLSLFLECIHLQVYSDQFIDMTVPKTGVAETHLFTKRTLT